MLIVTQTLSPVWNEQDRGKRRLGLATRKQQVEAGLKGEMQRRLSLSIRPHPSIFHRAQVDPSRT